jgi:O-antigen/teichoic acid export membrane protein
MKTFLSILFCTGCIGVIMLSIMYLINPYIIKRKWFHKSTEVVMGLMIVVSILYSNLYQ